MNRAGGDLWSSALQGVIVAVRGRALMPIALFIVAVAAAGCSSADGASSGDPTTLSTPEIVVPRTQPALKPAKDCSKSDVSLSPASEMEGVRLDVSTDPSNTSLLLQNTGSLSVIVVPDANFTTRLVAAPYANPTDQASRVALTAVNSSGTLKSVQELPASLPSTQVVILPPQWAVCALTDDVNESAAVRYLRDKGSSAEYFLTKGLSDELLSKLSAKRARPTLITCARGMLDVLKGRPDIPDVELYAGILSDGTPCRNGFKALLSSDERATQRTATTVLNTLERAPRLLDNTRLFDILATG